MERWFKEYLNETFGKDFDTLTVPPEGAKYGERLVYKYLSDKTPTRHELTQQELDEFNAEIASIAEGIGGTTFIPAQPPVTSGLPFPRFIDLKEKDIFWETNMKKYLESYSLLPSEDFDLEWAMGLLFASANTFYHLDFTHPKVKGIFSFEYEEECVSFKIHEAECRFKEFITLLEMYKELSEVHHFQWVKIAQIDSKISIAVC